MLHTQSSDVAIIGGGLAGLAAAAYPARAEKTLSYLKKRVNLAAEPRLTPKVDFVSI